MSDELVKRLREIDTGQRGWGYAKNAADRIEELEAELAKAVEALGGVMMHMPDYADTVWIDARATLAELTGGKNE